MAVDSLIPSGVKKPLRGDKKGIKGLNHRQIQYHYSYYTAHCLYFKQKYVITDYTFATLCYIYQHSDTGVSMTNIFTHQLTNYRACVARVMHLFKRGLIENINKKYTVTALFLSEIAHLSGQQVA